MIALRALVIVILLACSGAQAEAGIFDHCRLFGSRNAQCNVRRIPRNRCFMGKQWYGSADCCAEDSASGIRSSDPVSLQLDVLQEQINTLQLQKADIEELKNEINRLEQLIDSSSGDNGPPDGNN